MLKKSFRFLRNKYVYTTLALLVWLIGFDQNNMISQVELTRDRNALLEEKAYYEQEIQQDQQAMNELMSSMDNLERYGREKYLMKKKDEDIFLVVEE